MNIFKKIVSILLILSGLSGFIRKEFIPSLLLIFLGLVIFPSISLKIKENFKLWNNKVIRYGFYLFLLLISGAFIKTHDGSSFNDNSFTSDSEKKPSKYYEYAQKVKNSVEKLSRENLQNREQTINDIKNTKTYNDLVINKVVSSEYLPLLTVINNGVRSIYTNPNGQERFTIEEPLVIDVEKSENSSDKMSFAVSSIQLATETKGGIPTEIIDVFERYRKKYNLFGNSSKIYNPENKDTEEINKPYDMTGIFNLLDPNNETFLNKLFEANNSVSSWFTIKKDQTFLYPSISSLKEYKKHVKKVYPDSPYVLNVDFEVTAKQLFDTYEKNEVAADEKYKNKKIAVTGIINEIGKDITNAPYVSLKVDFLKNVTCYFSSENNKIISKLQKGQKITIAGTCKGKSLNMLVVVKNCKVSYN
ncbi:OB-fold protein [Tenacibaculum aestuarii]|uniref:OB-fold protein n=1 Tax=Tenacibaculum aestuarii TaxID=362781 RepID=UPI0038941384